MTSGDACCERPADRLHSGVDLRCHRFLSDASLYYRRSDHLLAPPATRWLNILQNGAEAARTFGVNLRAVRITCFCWRGGRTVGATLMVCP